MTEASLSVIIPAFNEQDTILRTLTQVLMVPAVSQVVIVDDGSDDGTGGLLDALSEPRVTVVHHPCRKGKGAAIRTAIPLSTAQFTVIQDADMEYDPFQLPSLVDAAVAGAPVVYGSRFRGSIQGMRLANYLGNRLLTWVTNRLFGAHLSDEATCYKLFQTELLQSLPLTCVRFEFCPEVTARLLRLQVPIVEVPISYKARPHSEGKKIRWWDLVEAIATLVRCRFSA